jgi:hypothetical protein
MPEQRLERKIRYISLSWHYSFLRAVPAGFAAITVVADKIPPTAAQRAAFLDDDRSGFTRDHLLFAAYRSRPAQFPQGII